MIQVKQKNEYLRRFEQIRGDRSRFVDHQDLRGEMVAQYAWAVPTDQAIDVLVRHSPVVEIGAGTGYWASLAAAAGCDIICYDITPPGGPEPNCYRHAIQYHLVEQGGPEMASQHPDRTLFLCWPPYATSMAAQCLEHYMGNRLILVGEGWGGCTGDDRFFELLDGWNETFDLDIPRWDGIHDYLRVFERKVA